MNRKKDLPSKIVPGGSRPMEISTAQIALMLATIALVLASGLYAARSVRASPFEKTHEEGFKLIVFGVRKRDKGGFFFSREFFERFIAKMARSFFQTLPAPFRFAENFARQKRFARTVDGKAFLQKIGAQRLYVERVPFAFFFVSDIVIYRNDVKRDIFFTRDAGKRNEHSDRIRSARYRSSERNRSALR